MDTRKLSRDFGGKDESCGCDRKMFLAEVSVNLAILPPQWVYDDSISSDHVE